MKGLGSINSGSFPSGSARPGKRALSCSQHSTTIDDDMRQDHVHANRTIDSTPRDNAPISATPLNTLSREIGEDDEGVEEPLVMNCVSLNTFVEGMRSPLYSQSCSLAKRRSSKGRPEKIQAKQTSKSTKSVKQRKTKKKLSPELLASLVDVDDEPSLVESASSEEVILEKKEQNNSPSQHHEHEPLLIDTSHPSSKQIPLPAESPRFSDFVSGNFPHLKGISTQKFDFSLIQQTIESVQESSRVITTPLVTKSNEISDMLARNFDRCRCDDDMEGMQSPQSVNSCPSDEMTPHLLSSDDSSYNEPLQYIGSQQTSNSAKDEPCKSIQELIEESYFQHVIGEGLSYIEEETPSGIRGEMSCDDESLLASSCSPANSTKTPIHEDAREDEHLEISFDDGSLVEDREPLALEVETPCSDHLVVHDRLQADEREKDPINSCKSDDLSIAFSLDDDGLASSSTRSSFDFVEDQDLRTVLRLTLEGGNAGLLFPSLSKVSSNSPKEFILGASRSSDDGLEYEIENLEALATDIQQEMEAAEQFASFQRSPTAHIRPTPLRRVSRLVRMPSPSEASSMDSSYSDATSISQFSPSSVGRTPASGRRVHFSNENEEYIFINESRSSDSTRNMGSFLDDFLVAVEDLMEDMTLTCARAVEHHRPSNVESVIGASTAVSPRSIARSTMQHHHG